MKMEKNDDKQNRKIKKKMDRSRGGTGRRQTGRNSVRWLNMRSISTDIESVDLGDDDVDGVDHIGHKPCRPQQYRPQTMTISATRNVRKRRKKV